MPQDSARHQHRHYKTLIILVISTTSGTFFLFWADQLAPTQRPQTLQSLTASAASPWDGISVRTESALEPGFFHFRIDGSGRLYKSNAWQTSRHDPRSEGVIQVVLTRSRVDQQPSRSQAKALARIVGHLQQKYGIPQSRIFAAPSSATAVAGTHLD